MLVLTRKESESIVIADSIEVIITRITGNKVRIGINAPRHISVYRKEIGPLFGPEFRPASARHNSLCSV